MKLLRELKRPSVIFLPVRYNRWQVKDMCKSRLLLNDMPSHVPDLGHAECRGISRPRKFHEITHFIMIDTFAQCVKECTDALWISMQ